MTPKSTLISMIITSCSLAWASYGQCQYQISAVIQGPECGVFGFPPTFGSAISDTGEVVGWYTACTIGTDEAFYWSAETGLITLERPPAVYAARANDIAPDGTIVGTYERTAVGFRGFVYYNRVWTELPPEPPGWWSFANAVNALGVVAGRRSLGAPVPHQAFTWQDGEFTDLGVLAGPNSSANDVSNQGHVVGWTGQTSLDAGDQGFLYHEGVTTLLGPIPNGLSSEAEAVSDDGVVLVGGSMLDGKTVVGRVCLFDDGVWAVLPNLPGYNGSAPGGLNGTLLAVGTSTFADEGQPPHRACLWMNGDAFDLNDLTNDFDGVIETGRAINNSGQILCGGRTIKGDNVAIVLTPVLQRVGDFNGDCSVDTSDLATLFDAWGTSDIAADFNGDGAVNAFDLAQLLANWG